jgi:hypothetical protein
MAGVAPAVRALRWVAEHELPHHARAADLSLLLPAARAHLHPRPVAGREAPRHLPAVLAEPRHVDEGHAPFHLLPDRLTAMMNMNRDNELSMLKQSLRVCETSAEAMEIVEAIVATADPRAVPVLDRVMNDTFAREVEAVALEGLVSFGGDAIAYMTRRLARVDTGDQAKRRRERLGPLLVLARLGDRAAMRELVAEHMDFGRSPMSTAAQLLRCGRAGIDAIVGIEDRALQGNAAYMLAFHRARTEATLLELVTERPEAPPPVALHALALMPSAKAEELFMRVFLEPGQDARLRRVAVKGLERLVKRRGESEGLHRATGRIREQIVAERAIRATPTSPDYSQSSHNREPDGE